MCKIQKLSKVFMNSAALLATLMIASPAAAEPLPQFDLQANCRSSGALWGGPRQVTESCLRSEEQARKLLSDSWNAIMADDRTSCSRLVRTGGQPSYVELLSCVEMARDARAFREQRARKGAEPPPLAPLKGTQSREPAIEWKVRAPA
jgi:hypothetical protein